MARRIVWREIIICLDDTRIAWLRQAFDFAFGGPAQWSRVFARSLISIQHSSVVARRGQTQDATLHAKPESDPRAWPAAPDPAWRPAPRRPLTRRRRK